MVLKFDFVVAVFDCLRTIFSYLSQLRVRASDGGFIPCTRDAVLTVYVERNEFPPVWQPSALYQTTILETFNVGQPVFTVQATDNDIQV